MRVGGSGYNSIMSGMSMNHDFSRCLLDGVQKGVKIKICLKHRYHKIECSMVYSKGLLTNVYKRWFM